MNNVFEEFRTDMPDNLYIWSFLDWVVNEFYKIFFSKHLFLCHPS